MVEGEKQAVVFEVERNLEFELVVEVGSLALIVDCRNVAKI